MKYKPSVDKITQPGFEYQIIVSVYSNYASFTILKTYPTYKDAADNYDRIQKEYKKLHPGLYSFAIVGHLI